jgi:hypothetical protein
VKSEENASLSFSGKDPVAFYGALALDMANGYKAIAVYNAYQLYLTLNTFVI